MSKYQQIQKELRAVSSKERAILSSRYFKTGPGQYGEGDRFIGATMPQQRVIAKNHLNSTLSDIQQMLDSKIHEERMIGLLILTYQFPKATQQGKSAIYDFYLKNTSRINNWDLVDVTAPKIIGEYLLDKDWDILYKLAESKMLWERRIAILSTSAFINKGVSKLTFNIAKLLMHDQEDLIHKAVGWMLREVGNKCGQSVEKEFLDKNIQNMPRTMLRYSIEKFSPRERNKYLTI